jgi:lycopene cyclase domain-containing protein
MTYLLLAVAFAIAGFLITFLIARSTVGRATWWTMAILLVATVIGDNFIVGNSIVAYEPSKILGLFIGVAPVEDFAYSLVAAVLIPAIWTALKRIER